MLEKFFASIGIGSAKADLEIPNPEARLGSTLQGAARIKGGNAEQEIAKMYITLALQSSYFDGSQTRPYNQNISIIKVAENLVVKPGQEMAVPISLEIPNERHLPVSRGVTRYHLRTSLEIPHAVNPVDLDDITIVPGKYLEILLEALVSLGFREQDDTGQYNGRYQQFKYKPSELFAQELDEIRVYPICHEDEMLLAMVLDKKEAGILGSILHGIHLDEKSFKIRIPYSEMNSVDQVADRLKEIIKQEYQKI